MLSREIARKRRDRKMDGCTTRFLSHKIAAFFVGCKWTEITIEWIGYMVVMPTKKRV
jgi:hypothetical protein